MDNLTIEPKFRDLIPKLTQEEYEQLERNILEDGRVKQPIVVWNNTIIDGHHRWYIIQKHPELPYEIENRDFENEYAAMAWACSNQLGRRNLTTKYKMYLIGEQYEAEKKAVGSNQYTKKRGPQNEASTSEKKEKTAYRVAREHGISHSTVNRADKFTKGIDIAETIRPGMREKLLNDKTDMTAVCNITDATPAEQKAIVNDLAADRPVKSNKTTKTTKSKPKESSENEPYNADDMLDEIRCAEKNLHAALRQTIVVLHNDVLNTKEGRTKALQGLNEIQDDVTNFINLIITKEENHETITRKTTHGH